MLQYVSGAYCAQHDGLLIRWYHVRGLSEVFPTVLHVLISSTKQVQFIHTAFLRNLAIVESDIN